MYRRSRRKLRGGFRKALEDPDAPLAVDMQGSSSTLLIAFGGMKGELGMPPFEFLGVTEAFSVKRIFIRDLHQAWYHRGIPGLGENVHDAADSLAQLIASHDVEKLVLAGSSAGGYAALAFGSLLGADTVLGFAPQTVIDPDALAEMDDHRWDGEVERLIASGAMDRRLMDLRVVLPEARRADTRYEIYFAEPGPGERPVARADMRHAERLRGLAGVRLYRFGKGEHRIARTLRDTGALDLVLGRALAGGSAERPSHP
jgi:pimeloyl-ACP methyl ester carboxylesterase